nr:ferrochelatase [Geodermatophilus sabuli]
MVLSFGGPEGPDDVLPFLENVTRGRGVPRERLEEVAQHYHHFGGVSPINEQNQALIATLERELVGAGIDLPVYWGNRNWAPYVEDTWRRLAEDGIEHVYVFATSAYASYSGCRQYHEDIARARVVNGGGPTAEKLPHYFDSAGFVRANADALAAAIAALPDDVRDTARLVATAHSIPDAMAAVAGPDGHAYEAELTAAAQRVVAAAAPGRSFDLVWQSRSGPPSVPWLEPDVNDHLRALAAAGERAVVLFPVGFISDHLEVVWDLDNEARQTAAELGLAFARAGTAGTHPAFVGTIRELVEERRAGGRPRLGTDCPASCCFVPPRRS